MPLRLCHSTSISLSGLLHAVAAVAGVAAGVDFATVGSVVAFVAAIVREGLALPLVRDGLSLRHCIDAVRTCTCVREGVCVYV